MKKIFIVLAACALTGCAGGAHQAQDCAQGFLDAFLANDFGGAAGFCSDDFRGEFSRSMEDFEKLDAEVKELLQKQCSQLQANVNFVQRVNESDTFIVNYNIVRCPDNSADSDENGEIVVSELKVVDGRIVSLNK